MMVSSWQSVKLFVKAKAGARRNEVKQIDETHFVVSVTEAPEKGRANEAIVEFIAEHLGVSKSSVQIIAGASARNKVLEIIANR
jgi:uncharacterized protein YggU (UPF0235/DUF167 family)